jgi:hypothetical protein
MEVKMNRFMFALLLALFLCTGLLNAQTNFVGLRDNTTATRDLVRQQDPNYPNVTPANYHKFLIQLYTSKDDVIDSLDSWRMPTGDDSLASTAANLTATLVLRFSPVGTWVPASFVFGPRRPNEVYTAQGDKVYERIFNAATIDSATAYIQFNGLYTIPTTNILKSILEPPINGWSKWIKLPPMPVADKGKK